MSKKTILVTGGAGYIGSHTIIELLANDNYNVISADCFYNSSPKAYTQINEITGKQFKTCNIDLCNEKEFDKIFTSTKIDGVIHFAAFKAVGESVELPLKYYHNNITSLVNLLALCEKHKVANVIFSSSCSVYGNVQTLPVNEDTPTPKAESPYAYTKQIGNKYCRISANNTLRLTLLLYAILTRLVHIFLLRLVSGLLTSLIT